MLLFRNVEITLDGNNEINMMCTTNAEEDDIPYNSGIFIYISFFILFFIFLKKTYMKANVKYIIL